ncbi:dynamin family protein [Streptomyces poonensis]|uniref:Dynamin N-terminal domain-containing protein n=1 Tax=Streptomyces poonensis TaxID=68255 RepID=A0A918PCW8_9ACTN|nr:dynamin family protein [Streptomyces poonensis]GGY99366.1 hypothetical protein GCM10010365_17560 [Streptomyces poonensis]
MNTTEPSTEHLVADCLMFARSLVERHVQAAGERGGLLTLLDATARRIDDPRLCVAVLGEFSSGKSTLLNALLRADLFPTGVRPDTATAVRIERAQHRTGYSFRLGDSPRYSVAWDEPSLPAAVVSALQARAPGGEPPGTSADLLRALTGQPPWCDLVDGLRVQWRAPVLDEGVVVIDTPGSNVDITAHVDVATRVAADEADGTIVLVSSQIQLTDSLARFLRKAVPPPVLQRCLFVVTRMDNLDVWEEDGVLEEVRRRAAHVLGIRHPLVLGAAPATVLKELAGKRLPVSSARWCRRFPDLERALVRFLAEERPVAAVLRTLRLLDAALTAVGGRLADRRQELEEAGRELRAQQVKGLDVFVGEQHAAVRAVVRRAEREMSLSVRVASLTSYVMCQAAVQELITGCATRTELSNALRSGVAAHVRDALDRLIRNVRRRVAEQVDRAQDEVTGLLEKAFTRQYAQLTKKTGLSAGARPSASRRRFPVRSAAATESARFGATAETLGKRITRVGPVGSAAAGAVLGNAVLPGVGTAVGAAMGALIGHVRRPGLAEARRTAGTDLRIRLREVYDEVDAAARIWVDTTVTALEEYGTACLAAWRENYAEEVGRLLTVQAAQQDHLHAELAAVAEDLATVYMRQATIAGDLTRFSHSPRLTAGLDIPSAGAARPADDV